MAKRPGSPACLRRVSHKQGPDLGRGLPERVRGEGWFPLTPSIKTGFSVLLLPQGRLILSNKTARTVAFFYTLFLHCLVFLVSVGDYGGGGGGTPH